MVGHRRGRDESLAGSMNWELIRSEKHQTGDEGRREPEGSMNLELGCKLREPRSDFVEKRFDYQPFLAMETRPSELGWVQGRKVSGELDVMRCN